MRKQWTWKGSLESQGVTLDQQLGGLYPVQVLLLPSMAFVQFTFSPLASVLSIALQNDQIKPWATPGQGVCPISILLLLAAKFQHLLKEQEINKNFWNEYMVS